MFSKKITLNVIYQFAGKGLSILLALLTLGVLSRYLGVKGMGEYGVVLRYLGFFGITADLGLNVITAREISKKGITNKAHLLANAFTLRLVSAVLILALSLILIYFLPYTDLVKKGVVVGSLAFFFILVTQIFQGVFQKYLVTQKSVIADLVGRMIILFLTLYFVLQQDSLIAFLWAMVAGNGLMFALTLFFTQKYYPLSLRFDFKIWQKFLIFAWPVALSNFLILIYFNVDALMLSWMRPMEEVGLYHVAYKVLETFFQFMVLFIGLFVPILSQNLMFKLKFKKYLQTAFNGVLFFGIPLMFAGILLSGDILKLVGGADFMTAIPILQILFLAMFFLFINYLMHNATTVLDLQKKSLWIYAVVAVLNIVSNLYMIPLYGAQGAALTTLISEFLIFVAIYFFFKKQKGYYPHFFYGGKIVLIALAMFTAIWSVRDFDLVVKLLVGTIVYFGLFFLFLGKKEVKIN